MFETLDSVVRSTKNIGFWMGVPRRIRGYEPRVQLKIQKSTYEIRTVSTRKEFQQILSLRYAIFEREFRGNWIPFGWDADEYDFLGDHLVIEDLNTGRIVGTYRLICSRFSNVFYTASEFELDSFLATPGVKLELGRACIHPRYRNGAVMGLLWRGVMEYARQVQATHLFGCASIKTLDPRIVKLLQDDFNARHALYPDEAVRPNEDYQAVDPTRFALDARGEAKDYLPPLLKSYLKAGAQVACEPAYDRYFRCVDFFTVLDLSSVSPLYGKRFIGNQIDPEK